MNEGRRLENFKNVVIVVLFVSAILLLYLLWQPRLGGISVEGLLESSALSKDIPGPDRLVTPLFAAVSGGGGSFAIDTKDSGPMFAKALEEMKAYLEQGSSQTQEISRDQYYQAMEDWESVQFELGSGLPLSDFCSYFCERSPGSDAAGIGLDVLGFSKASSESFFVLDREEGKYYRLLFPEERDAVGTLSAMAVSTDCSSYIASEILGGSGRALIPLALESTAMAVRCEDEISSKGEVIRDRMASSIFGSTFDFVRRITDSYGNVTYMYGYGEKTFYASVDGSFAYNTEASESSSTGVFDDMETAVRFMARLGGLGEDSGMGLVLERYSESGSGRNRRRTFEFCQTLEGVRIEGEKGPAVSVTLTGGVVTEAIRNMSFASKPQQAEEAVFAADGANVIASNANHIYNILSNNTLAVASDEAFARASEDAVTLAPGYFASPKDGELKPCWILTAKGGTRFFFDLYSAAPLGFARRED
ncbi:MAG: hypothetical protein IJM17_04755 [Firmicutes bacterium]|nr:hypothetical protein [Bacillota bacterium]